MGRKKLMMFWEINVLIWWLGPHRADLILLFNISCRKIPFVGNWNGNGCSTNADTQVNFGDTVSNTLTMRVVWLMVKVRKWEMVPPSTWLRTHGNPLRGNCFISREGHRMLINVVLGWSSIKGHNGKLRNPLVSNVPTLVCARTLAFAVTALWILEGSDMITLFLEIK